jgi:hypothetical protein
VFFMNATEERGCGDSEEERIRGRSLPPDPVMPPYRHAGTLEDPGQS